mmetsp:Transcript_23760/g.38118  ORF Transcript_23760/g.38118 Transcript_23760/m.38118 type:complete len:282 (-) Transcript_23760:52-897(-)
MPKKHHFAAEYAKSSMATCRVCMAKIVKDSLRVGHLQADLENDAALASNAADKESSDATKRLAVIAGATRWHHFECFPRMKGAKWMSANLPASPGKIQGFSSLKKADQKKLESLWKVIAGSGSSKNGSGATSVGAKRKASEMEEAGKSTKSRGKSSNGSDKAAAKLAKLTSVQGVLTAAQLTKVQKLEEELSSRTAAQLQFELAKNSQGRAGKKEELTQRVAEGRLLGALPPCPKCEHGQIHWSRLGGWFNCPGYFDREAKIQKRCNFRAKDMSRSAWKKM